jgi:hypothetical protein
VCDTGVDFAENRGEHSFGFRFGHLGLTAQCLAPAILAIPPKGNPHAMPPVLPGLQAASLKTLSTHLLSSFLRQMR